ncbi:MAG TPA: hypothetical protein VKP30_00195 [Polyangiaceae bacterium]|nr:hypothetical protein [Polyangiaceae bacterium]
MGGAAGGGGISGTGTCNYPACLYSLFSACPAAPSSSSCTTQETTNATTSQTNACYGDGSAVTSVVDLTTYASKMTFKKGGTTCYTMETSVAMSGLVPTSTSTTLRNGLGNVVATETWDVASDTTTVTCTGAQPVVLNAACDATSDGTYNCQPGVCNP